MKKTLLIFITIALSLILSSCDYIQVLSEENDEPIVLIEFIKYNNPLVIENPKGGYKFDSKLLTIYESLEEDLIETFMKELDGISDYFAPVYRTYINSHNGFGIRISYADKRFRILTVTEVNNSRYPIMIYSATYNDNNEIKKDYNAYSQVIIEGFEKLLAKYCKHIEERK